MAMDAAMPAESSMDMSGEAQHPVRCDDSLGCCVSQHLALWTGVISFAPGKFEVFSAAPFFALANQVVVDVAHGPPPLSSAPAPTSVLGSSVDRQVLLATFLI